MQEHWKLEEKA